MAEARSLSDLVLDEISAVDDGANQHARVVIVKAKKPSDEEPDGDEDGVDHDVDGDGKTPGKRLDPKNCDGKVMKAVQSAIDAFAPAIIEHVGEIAGSDAAALAAAVLKERTMDLTELTKALDEAKTAIQAKDTEIAKLKGERDEAIAKVKSPPPAATEEELLKSVDPALRALIEKSRSEAEDLRKQNAVNSAVIAKMAEDREIVDAIAKAEAAGIGEPETAGPILHRIAKNRATAEDAAEVGRLLKAASAQSATAKLYETRGSVGAEPGSAEDLMKAKAEEIQKANAGMTYAVAFSKALEQNPDLYDRYIAKRRG